MKSVIREATIEDLPAIVAIYNQAVRQKIASCDITPISIEKRRAWFTQQNPLRPVLVAQGNGMGDILGYINLSDSIGNREGYKISADIGLYVDQHHQGQGLGNLLLGAIIQRAISLGLENLTASIFSTNKTSLNLFQKYNFEKWGYFPSIAKLGEDYRDVIFLGRRIADKTAIPNL